MSGTDPTARRVAEAIAARAHRDHLLDRLNLSARVLGDLRAQAEDARRAAEREGIDVERLEAFSARRLRESWRGTLADTLRRERDEDEAAVAHAAEALARLTAAQQSHASLQDAFAALGDVDRDVEEALAAREADLHARGVPATSALLDVAQEIGALQGERTELAEARRAAFLVVVRVRELAEHLAGADGWAAGGRFLGGGITTTSIRHDRVDEAERLSLRADAAVAALARELGDVGLVGTGGDRFPPAAGRFADPWLGSIATVRTFEARLGAARALVDEVLGDVEDLLERLDRRLDRIAEHLDRQEDRRRVLLEA
jgi:hypothetical protein